ncbi:MAG: hypothetical protein ACOYLT_10060 [Flavobacterium sp.]|uniref:hypothetical protein n=1 Tax=Flavobacterium sp. TaxID=239 RepID=UPI003BE0E448
MKTKFNSMLVAFIITIANGFSQDKKPFVIKPNDDKGDIVMTWRANTPEQEMKDDIKALANHGVTITYDAVKRNSKGEITAIKVTYADRKGNKGSLDMDNQKPITTIKFFKQGENIGFGEPVNDDFLSSANGFNGFLNGQNPMQLFNFSQGDDDENTKSYSYSFSDDNSSAKSRTFIQKDGKKPLVIEDGEVVEGGDDYTKEELEEVQKNNKVERSAEDAFPNFNFNDQGNMAEQMKKMQEQLNQLMQKQQDNNPTEESYKSLRESKEELEKAKEELKKAKQELEKTKTILKTQKA